MKIDSRFEIRDEHDSRFEIMAADPRGSDPR